MKEQSDDLVIARQLYQQIQKEVKLQTEIDRLEQEIKRMRRSFSWRITFPFRAIRVLIRKTFFLCKLLKDNIKIEGGIINFLTVAYLHIRDFNTASFLYGFKNRNIPHAMKYETWLKRYGSITNRQTNLLINSVGNSKNDLKISIVISVRIPNKTYLIECLEAVKRQIYPNWELCIATSATTHNDIKILLNEYAQKDKRIKLIASEENDNEITLANNAISLATGTLITFLDPNDLLVEDALFWIVHTANKNPESALFYSDEDKLDQHGVYCDPVFKPDFNQELLFAYNYLNNLTAFKKKIVDEIGGFKKGFEGAQKYDLILRYIEKISVNRIIHFPKILCHCRIMEDRKVLDGVAGEKALNDYFIRNNISAITHFNNNINVYETHYVLRESPLVSIIIPTKNAHELVTQCIESIYEETSYNHFEIILIDNNSDNHESIACFSDLKKRYPNLQVIKDSTAPFNYSRINNNAAKESKGRFLLFLNNDTKVINSEWLTEMVAIAQQPNVGAVGAKLFYPDNTLQHAGVVIGASGVPWFGAVADHVFRKVERDAIGYMARTHVMQRYSAVTAACLLISKEHFFLVNGFNEVELAVAFNDIDLCLKLQEQGLRNIWTPHAELYHYESISRGSDDETPEKKQRSLNEAQYMYDQWNTDTGEDPYYNPNLSRLDADFSVVKPRVDLFLELSQEP